MKTKMSLDRSKVVFRGVDFTDFDAVKKHYRKLIKKLHPDNGGNDTDGRLLTQLKEAFEEIKRFHEASKPKPLFQKLTEELDEINLQVERMEEQFNRLAKKRKKVRSKLKAVEKQLKSRILYLIFNNKTTKQIVRRLVIISLVVEALILAFLAFINVGGVVGVAINIALFALFASFFLRRISSTKSLNEALNKLRKLQHDIDKEQKRLEHEICTLEVRKTQILTELTSL